MDIGCDKFGRHRARPARRDLEAAVVETGTPALPGVTTAALGKADCGLTDDSGRPLQVRLEPNSGEGGVAASGPPGVRNRR
jgi:hypothetical protein